MEMSINLDTYSGNFKETLHILLVMIIQFLHCSGVFTVIPSQYALTQNFPTITMEWKFASLP